jgi:hypothetical protein
MSVFQRHLTPSFALWLSFLSVCLSTCPLVAGSLDSVRCYVWDFATRNGTRNEVTRQLTVEFEEKLTQKNFCRVLERRNYARLIAQKDNEKAVLRLEGISKATVDTLKANDANTVVFGEVYDDINSGSFKVSITLQNFDNTKNVWSVHIPRGVINDAGSREKAMEELVKTMHDESRATEREMNRKKYYVQISKTLNEFILRAKNLKDAFRSLPDVSYGNKRITQDLSNATTPYNEVVESLKINQDALVEEVFANWQKPELAEDFRHLLHYALFEIHDTEILVFNEIRVKSLAILGGKITNEDEAEMTKTYIKTTVPGRVETLNAKLLQFERTAMAFLEALKP